MIDKSSKKVRKCITVDANDWNKLVEKAKAYDVTVSSYIRIIIKRDLNKKEKKPNLCL